MPEPLEKPRGRCTPYAFFLNICREQCDKKRGDKLVDFEVLSSVAWERWGRMTEAQKKRFTISKCFIWILSILLVHLSLLFGFFRPD